MAMNAFEKFRTQVGDIFALNTKSISSDVKKESRKVKFDGVDVVVVDGVKSYFSELIDIRKYKKIDFFIKNGVYAQGWPMEISIITGLGVGFGSAAETTTFYDWNSEKWVASYQGEAAVPVTQSPNAVQILSTHPNAYWLRELNADQIRLKATISENLELDKDSQFEVWFVGELNV